MNDSTLIEQQEAIELQYNCKHIDKKLRKFITETLQPEMAAGVTLIEEYMAKDYYKSKNQRITQLQNLDIPTLIVDIFVGIAYCQTEELFTAVTAQMASRLKFSDKREAITTVAELLAVLCHTDVFDICKASKADSLVVISNMALPQSLLCFVQQSRYLPPMICEPLELSTNYDSGYLTHNDSLVLGTGNHHEGDLCLDVLNIVNKVQLSMDTQFLSTVEEEPTFDVDTPEKVEQWSAFKKQSYGFYLLMTDTGNQFHLTHKVDKRGRIYASGYHITTQGTPFKKASVELAKKECVTGI